MISNSPRETTVIEIEARKSLALNLYFKDSTGALLNMEDGTLSFVAAKVDRQGVVTPLVDVLADMTLAANGLARVKVQADELSIKAGEYPFAITLTLEGYSTVVVKGHIKVVENHEYDSMFEQFATAMSSQALEVIFRNQGDIHVNLATLLPPDVLRVPLGGTTGQVLVKQSGSDHDLAWGTLVGGLSAVGQPLHFAPLSQGDDSWEWNKVVMPSELAATSAALTAQLTAALAAVEVALQEATPIGEVKEYSGTALPAGGKYLWADNAEHLVADEPELFAVIGYQFGGAGPVFRTPPRQGRVAVGVDPTQPEFDTLGKLYGTKTHTLTAGETPVLDSASSGAHTHTGTAASSGAHTHTGTAASAGSHNHTQSFSTHGSAAAGGSSISGMTASSGNSSGVAQQTTQSAGAHTHTVSVTSAGAHTHTVNEGGGGKHNNVQPGVAMNFIIRSRA